MTVKDRIQDAIDKYLLDGDENHLQKELLLLRWLYKLRLQTDNDTRTGFETYDYGDVKDTMEYISDRWDCSYRLKWLIDGIENHKFKKFGAINSVGVSLEDCFAEDHLINRLEYSFCADGKLHKLYKEYTLNEYNEDKLVTKYHFKDGTCEIISNEFFSSLSGMKSHTREGARELWKNLMIDGYEVLE